ncbi:hypothetical protein NPIL_60261 [Nephila pilipes]|uniref:Uncharacterized protein n=1 Tax=Nephila pilipes TaxID=299642 RepID=A0A8X6P0X2_NEPPI|nr:hypothetical protein NPIL_60261 [Nephila pilipes]
MASWTIPEALHPRCWSSLKEKESTSALFRRPLNCFILCVCCSSSSSLAYVPPRNNSAVSLQLSADLPSVNFYRIHCLTQRRVFNYQRNAFLNHYT